MNNSGLAVVILNYNGKKFFEQFLESIVKHSLPHRVIVADNGSSDDSLHWVAEHFPQVHIIRNNGNYGYARGYNLALKEVHADYYVLLNSDVQVTANWIQPVVDLMEQDPQIAACQPKILDHAHPERFEYAGAGGGYIDKYGYPFCRGRLFNSIENDERQFDNATEVFWATGACLFVRASAFWQVGGFDDDYFAHMEEIDLCWRLKNMGHRVYVQPRSVVYHVGGGTLNKLSSRKTFLNFRNNMITYTKNNAPGWLFFKIFFRMALDGIAALKFLSDGQPKHLFAVLKAHVYYYFWLPRTLRKRWKMTRLPGFRFSSAFIYKGNIVAEHFLRNKRRFNDLRQGFFSE